MDRVVLSSRRLQGEDVEVNENKMKWASEVILGGSGGKRSGDLVRQGWNPSVMLEEGR